MSTARCTTAEISAGLARLPARLALLRPWRRAASPKTSTLFAIPCTGRTHAGLRSVAGHFSAPASIGSVIIAGLCSGSRAATPPATADHALQPRDSGPSFGAPSGVVFVMKAPSQPKPAGRTTPALGARLRVGRCQWSREERFMRLWPRPHQVLRRAALAKDDGEPGQRLRCPQYGPAAGRAT